MMELIDQFQWFIKGKTNSKAKLNFILTWPSNRRLRCINDSRNFKITMVSEKFRVPPSRTFGGFLFGS